MNVWSEYFSSVPDPRRVNGRHLHPLSDLLGLSLCAMLCGADNFVEFSLFGQQRREFLQKTLGLSLPHGIPSHDTFTRLFAQLQPEVLEKCLSGWLLQWQVEHKEKQEPERKREGDQESVGATSDGMASKRRHLCIDGKTARGTWEHTSQMCALTTVSIFASELRLILKSGRVPPQGGEKHLALSLLELLDLEGALITGDAAYCQSEVAQIIHDNHGDYVLALKTNHRTLYTQVKNAFEQTVEEDDASDGIIVSPSTEPEEGHGRSEVRLVECRSLNEIGMPVFMRQKWPGLQSVVRVEREREINKGLKAGTKSNGVWFYLSSLPADDALLAQTIRAHWSIENQAHWVLDVVFNEDRCRTRRDHAPYNLALLRRIALNLLRQNQGKNSLKAMRKAVTWNQDLLCKMLQAPLPLF